MPCLLSRGASRHAVLIWRASATHRMGFPFRCIRGGPARAFGLPHSRFCLAQERVGGRGRSNLRCRHPAFKVGATNSQPARPQITSAEVALCDGDTDALGRDPGLSCDLWDCEKSLVCHSSRLRSSTIRDKGARLESKRGQSPSRRFSEES